MTNQTHTLSVEEAANELQVTPRTLRNMIERGRFPNAYKLDPYSDRSTWRIPATDIAALKQARQQPG